MFHELTGIDLHQLVLELKAGIRLPTPAYCPLPISSLIKQCFLEEPAARPSFSQIKETVALAYREIRRVPLATIHSVCSDKGECVEYADIQMEAKYLDMRKRNKDYHESTNLPKYDSSSHTASLNRSEKRDMGRYISLEHTLSLGDPLLHRSMNPKANIELRQAYGVSYGNARYKRHYSFSGEIHAPHTALSPAKSYPNPMYMTDLSGFISNKLPIIESIHEETVDKSQ